MPEKNWEAHQAEITQLYFTEGKTLDEVRDTLQGHGFEASTRSYRTKIKEWKLTKYRSGKNRTTVQGHRQSTEHENYSTPSTDSVEASPVSVLDKSDEVRMTFGDISIPTRHISYPELLSLIEGTVEGYHALEILLMKWQPNGEYMKAALEFLHNAKHSLRTTEDPVPNLISLIEANLSSEEGHILMKALLEADLYFDDAVLFAHPYNVPSWKHNWRLACNENDWEEAKKILYHFETVMQGAGKTFRNCARVVIAERLLQRSQTRLNQWRLQATPLSTYESLAAERYRRQYIDILKDFRYTTLELDPSFYKYWIQIIDLDEILVKEPPKQLELLAKLNYEDHHLLSLQSDGTKKSIVNAWVVLPVEHTNNSNVQENMPRSSEAVVPHLPLNSAGGVSCQTRLAHTSSEHPGSAMLPLEGPGEVDTLQRILKAGYAYLRAYIQSVGEKYCTVLFCGSSTTGSKSVFDLVLQTVPQDGQAAFTQALLLACSQLDFILPPAGSSYNLFLHWRSVVMQPSWNVFNSSLDMVSLESSMSHDAAKLVRDSTKVLVGERLKEACKPRQDMDELLTSRRHLQDSYSDAEVMLQARLAAHREGQAHYRTICEDLKIL